MRNELTEEQIGYYRDNAFLVVEGGAINIDGGLCPVV